MMHYYYLDKHTYIHAPPDAKVSCSHALTDTSMNYYNPTREKKMAS